MVNDFLKWPLPASVCSDTCVSNPKCLHRSGTNLLTANEAKQMFEAVVLPKIETGKEPDVLAAIAALKPVIDYVQTIKNGVPVGIVCNALQALESLGGKRF